MLNLFDFDYRKNVWIAYISDVFQFDWFVGVCQEDLFVACKYFYFG